MIKRIIASRLGNGFMNSFAPNSLDELLFHKVAPPPSSQQLLELKRIASLDVSDFKEADVREEIINPILKIIGYQKGQEHSVDREKHIKFVGSKDKYIDYSLTVWEQDFWLIEAKRPHPSETNFGYTEARQAFEYASHPQIRAALVVICDGIKLEIFDREENVETPIYQLKMTDLVQKFSQLSQYLAPINVWFFYRRRLIRELNRAFEKEGNLNRVTEFKNLMSNNLDSMRGKFLSNFRAMDKTKNGDEYPESLKKASPIDITESLYFSAHSLLGIHNMTHVLINECKEQSAFHTLYRLFPDHPRDANDFFFMNSIDFLIALEDSDLHISWIPDWLKKPTQKPNAKTALENLIPLLLSHFEHDQSRKTISLVSSAYRRLAKILSVIQPDRQQVAQKQHLMTRLFIPENTWEQILSTPERNMIFEWDRFSLLLTNKFVKKFSDEQNKFKVNLAREEWKRLIETEIHLLKQYPNYNALLAEFNFGETHPTQYCSVSYDFLGHGTLCAIEQNEKWTNYVLEHHKGLVIEIAQLGSWSAQKMLRSDIQNASNTEYQFDDEIACRRFFFNDTNLYEQLRLAYSGKLT